MDIDQINVALADPGGWGEGCTLFGQKRLQQETTVYRHAHGAEIALRRIGHLGFDCLHWGIPLTLPRLVPTPFTGRLDTSLCLQTLPIATMVWAPFTAFTPKDFATVLDTSFSARRIGREPLVSLLQGAVLLDGVAGLDGINLEVSVSYVNDFCPTLRTWPEETIPIKQALAQASLGPTFLRVVRALGLGRTRLDVLNDQQDPTLCPWPILQTVSSLEFVLPPSSHERLTCMAAAQAWLL